MVMADKINVLEGIVEDFSKGRIPNIFAEKGGKARWKYDKKNLALNMLVQLTLGAAAYAWFFRIDSLKKMINI